MVASKTRAGRSVDKSIDCVSRSIYLEESEAATKNLWAFWSRNLAFLYIFMMCFVRLGFTEPVFLFGPTHFKPFAIWQRQFLQLA